MSVKNFASRLDDIDFGLKNVTGLAYAVYEAIYRGAFTADTYEGAVYILLQESQKLSEASAKLVEEMYAEVRQCKNRK